MSEVPAAGSSQVQPATVVADGSDVSDVSAVPGLSSHADTLQGNEAVLSGLREDNARLELALAAATEELQRLRRKVSHDLRVPLRQVGAFAQVIEEDFGPQLDAQVVAHLKTIQTAAAQMGQMLDGILAEPRRTTATDGSL